MIERGGHGSLGERSIGAGYTARRARLPCKVMQRYAIRFDTAYAVLSRAVFLPPSGARLELDGAEVRVRMSWAFRATFPRSAVMSAVESWKRSGGILNPIVAIIGMRLQFESCRTGHC